MESELEDLKNSQLSILQKMRKPVLKPTLKVWLSCVQLFVTPQTVVFQTPLSTGFSTKNPPHWSGVPFPSQGELPNTGIKARKVSCIAGIARLSFNKGCIELYELNTALSVEGDRDGRT